MKIFLHIGASKCASSSIQEHFSYNHTQGKFAYATLMRDGNIITGEQIELRAKQSALNYTNSKTYNLEERDSYFTNLKTALKACEEQFDTLFLSNEGWSGQYQFFRELTTILSQYHVEVIFIIRPPVLWANSAWWQWLHWDPYIESVDAWVKDFNQSTIFLNNYAYFKNISYIKAVYLLSLQSNIIEQIYKIMDLPHNQDTNKKNNVASSAELLYFLSLNKELRPMHSPTLEFILNRHLKKRSPTPWVLSRENIEHILNSSKKSCLELAKHISNENILENPLWWDVAVYEDKIKNYNRDIYLPDETISDMLSEAHTVIQKLRIQLNQNVKKVPAPRTLRDAYVTIKILDKQLRSKTIVNASHKSTLAHAKQHTFLSLHLSYLYYRILSKLTFGDTQKIYSRKEHEIHNLLNVLKQS